MKKIALIVIAALTAVGAMAQEFNRIPYSWKWIGDKEVLLSVHDDADPLSRKPLHDPLIDIAGE